MWNSQWDLGRSCGNAGVYRDVGNYADVPVFCTVLLLACGQSTDRKWKLRI